MTEAASRFDAFLNGRIQVIQPDGHHHAGLEAMLLSASVPGDFTGTVVDLGAGVGVAGMAIAARAPGARVTLVERDPVTIEAARSSLAHLANAAFAPRVTIVAADITAPEAQRVSAGLGREFADAVVTNPPFYDASGGTQSPVAELRGAHVLEEGDLETWVRTAASILKPGGRLIVIFRADGLSQLFGPLAGRFGGITILPVHPRADHPARRILIAAEKGSRAPERLLPGLALHVAVGNGYLQPIERILREGASLAEVYPAWR
ncbi:MAG TPA: methyltransferase [Bauldia sp.]|nr:methyltransferase [Bauldia sp.]